MRRSQRVAGHRAEHRQVLKQVLHRDGATAADGLVADMLHGRVQGHDEQAASGADCQQYGPCRPDAVDVGQQQERQGQSISRDPGPPYAVQGDESRCGHGADHDADREKQRQFGDVTGVPGLQNEGCPGHQHDAQRRCGRPEQAQRQYHEPGAGRCEHGPDTGRKLSQGDIEAGAACFQSGQREPGDG